MSQNISNVWKCNLLYKHFVINGFFERQFIYKHVDFVLMSFAKSKIKLKTQDQYSCSKHKIIWSYIGIFCTQCFLITRLRKVYPGQAVKKEIIFVCHELFHLSCNCFWCFMWRVSQLHNSHIKTNHSGTALSSGLGGSDIIMHRFLCSLCQ